MVLTCELNRGFDSLHAALPLFAGVSCCIDCLVLTLVLTTGSIQPSAAPIPPAVPRQHQAAPGPPGEGVRQPAGATKVDGL